MKNKKTNYIRARIDDTFKDKYMSFCKKHKYIFSKRLRVLMERDMDRKNNK